MKDVKLGRDSFCVCATDLLVSHTKIFVVRSGNLRPVQVCSSSGVLSIRQCQLLISSGTPTALPSFIHKNTTHCFLFTNICINF